jgi:hypothetical protein
MMRKKKENRKKVVEGRKIRVTMGWLYWRW